MSRDVAAARLAGAFRDEYGRVLAALIAELRDFDLAEEALADALRDAAAQWERRGVPDAPAAWLLTVARRRAVDRLRRLEAERRRLPLLVVPDTTDPPPVDDHGVPDERLRLLFTACHPALSRASQVALTLRVVGGLSTREIARAFLVSEATMTRRIARAKRKIRDARIPYRTPEGDEARRRLDGVLTVIYLVFNEGHTPTAGESDRVDLQEEAVRLAELVHRLTPDEPEAAGLLALLLLHSSRRGARARGRRLVPLPEQDRSRWDRSRIERGRGLVQDGFASGEVGPYLVQAAIAGVHAEAPSYDATDWRRIVALYDLLLEAREDPVVRLNRAVAVMEAGRPHDALAEVEALADDLHDYAPWLATWAEALARAGRRTEAATAFERAAAAAGNDAVRAHLRGRARRLGAD